MYRTSRIWRPKHASPNRKTEKGSQKKINRTGQNYSLTLSLHPSLYPSPNAQLFSLRNETAQKRKQQKFCFKAK
jgi:hypothetical protein